MSGFFNYQSAYCGKCGKFYNPDTGHDCASIRQIEEAHERLEQWLGPHAKNIFSDTPI